jgi:hypothetical protein
VLGLLAATYFSWVRAERGLLTSRPKASPPLENKFHGEGAPMRTQGLERGWLRLKRAATTQPFTRSHLPFKINSRNKRLFNPILYMFTQIYVQSPGSLSFIILQQTMYIIPSSAATSILKWMEWIFFFSFLLNFFIPNRRIILPR